MGTVKIIGPALIACSLGLWLAACHGAGQQVASPADTSPARANIGNKINGVSFVNPPKPLKADGFKSISRVNADWVALIPFSYCFEDSAALYFHVGGGQWWGETVTGNTELIKQAQAAGLKVMVKPQVWVVKGSWVGDFDLGSAERWALWEKGYRQFILTHARVADSLGVALFCIGTELLQSVRQRPQFWTQLIHEVKQVYSGQLTYAANWNDYEEVPFWQDLDYIGVDAYYPLAEEEASIDEIAKAWRRPKESLARFSQEYGKPILFTEYGWRSVPNGAWRHWELPSHWRYQGPIDQTIQANAYSAFFKELWPEPWFAGGFLWKWYPEGQEGSHWEEPPPSGWTPQGKLAEKVIREGYKSP